MLFQPIKPKKVSSQIAEQIRSSILTGEDHHLLYDHHRVIFEAIKARNPEVAREAMLTHLTFAEQRSIAYVARKSS